ncbi:Gfo/Idh/MocA family protein [Acetatifactor muris]|uniref:Gfo/Idh/MocA family protein n=1 Tax=Acetatifactor muris TaxID=879566 RepID=UPI0023F20E3D|nr:Gfo/Idh/MocA family oxidoreductase [Acetatifactor muris]
MKSLKICFTGIGSIARRHIRNLRTVCRGRGIELRVDAVRRSEWADRKDDELQLGRVYTSYEEMDSEYDVVFITNPTEYHIETLKNIMKYGRNFFIEKPVSSVSQIEEAVKLRLKKDAVYYVACPLRYNAVIQYLKENVDFGKVISIRSISSSYLPEWRPGTDYRQTYSASRRLGGGVSIDLIHEWDYLTFLIGMPQKIFYLYGKKSALEIDSEDYAIYMAEYEDKIVELHLDYFGRKTIRQVMILTDEDTVCGDLVNNRIEFMKTGEIIDFHERRDDYQIRELEHFLDMIEGRAKSDSDIGHAVEVLKLTQGRIEVEK